MLSDERDLALPRRRLLALLAALGACGLLAAIMLVELTDDVTERDGLTVHDPALLQWFIDRRGDAVTTLAHLASGIGSFGAVFLLALMGGLAVWRRGAHLAFALAPCTALCGAGASVATGKVVIGRERPPVEQRLVPQTRPSFPSGHTTDSTALFVTLAVVVALVVLRRPLWRALAVVAGAAIAIAVGLSRLVLGVHWPTDVLAGWALGATAAAITLGVALVATHVPPSAVGPAAGVVRTMQRRRPTHAPPEPRPV